MQQANEMNNSSCWAKYYCFPTKFRSSKAPPENEEKTAALKQNKPGGWKSMPYILGNETCERLASIGLLANFMVFLRTEFHMNQVLATNVINIWSGFANFAPLLGAFISDTYLGRFRTIAYATVAGLLGMVTLTLIEWIPELHPPRCNAQSNQCIGPTTSQIGVLAMSLGFLTIASAGIRPCSIPFGVDQFDSSTEEGRRGIASFFNWYYMSFTVVLIIAITVIVYIQTSVSWVLGLAIPTVLMFISIILFFVGARLYVYVQPEGSVFTSIVQVVVAAYKKRNLKLPQELDQGAFYDPPLEGTLVKKLPLTNKFRLLNKAALITEGELQSDGSNIKPWRLCSAQKVEETKCLVKVIPIWASGIICFTAMAQQGTFTVSQAIHMNRRLSRNFQIPPGSLSVISMITIGLWLPLYDRVLVPAIRKVTRVEGGITLLQRMGIGIVFSLMSMVVAGLVERMRRDWALSHARPDGITVFWLAPQLILMGFAEAFNIIGQIEFYNREFPENMSSLANSLFSCTMAGASYLSALLVNVVHKTTGKNGRPDWLTDDINKGRLENLYYLIAGLGVLNLVYFVWVAKGYQYKTRFDIDEDIELNNGVKK